MVDNNKRDKIQQTGVKIIQISLNFFVMNEQKANKSDSNSRAVITGS